MNTPFLPPKTAEKLAEHQGVGERHKAALDIAMSMIGNGWSERAVYDNLRSHFPPEKTDKELADIVTYAVSKSPTPSVPRNGAFQPRNVTVPLAAPAKKKTPSEQAMWWLAGSKITEAEFIRKSQIPVPSEPVEALKLVLEQLYTGAENLNIVCAYDMLGEKARPKGPGRTMSRDKWVEYIESKGVPASTTGAWFRPNPTKAQGSGLGGAITDSDIAAFRFLLVESDTLGVELQLSLLNKLKLPMACVLLSGGASAHAWIRMDAKNSIEYDHLCRKLLSVLAPFGIDQANKNPSRLSRLPSAVRKIGASGDGVQRLLQLNPAAKAITELEIDAIENRLLCPCVEEKPFHKLIEEAIPRYEYMIANRGKLGVPTGIQSFDKVTGGLKPGGYTLLAAATGVGKTTVALNFLNAALEAKYGVVLFSLEMPKEDIVDMMFSLNCNVDRNAFNTGEFLEEHIKSMTVKTGEMKNLPLWVDDDPAITMAAMRRRVLSLVSESKIGLVVVDYAQLTMVDERPDNREQAVAAIALGLRLLSREANVPVLVLSQLNDDGRIRESRRLAHEATTVLLLEREEGDLSNPCMVMKVAKGRKIPSTPILLYLKAEHCRITERGKISESDVPKQKQLYND